MSLAWNPIKKTFGTKKSSLAPLGVVQELKKIAETAIENQIMLDGARESQQPYVLLTPAIADEVGEAAGWFGGLPRLPDVMPWPQIDGVPLRFACQIDLSQIPVDVWSGIGPRRGWLVVFFHPEKVASQVLHVDGPIAYRYGPEHADRPWFHLQDDSDIMGQHATRFWPVLLTRYVAPPPKPMGFRKGRAEGFPDPRESERPDLTDPAFHPFNWPTMRALVNIVAEKAVRWSNLVAFLLAKELRNADRTELTSIQPTILDLVSELKAIQTKIAGAEGPFDPELVDEILARIATMPAYDIVNVATDEEGYSVIKIARINIADKPPYGYDWWYSFYSVELYRHAICAYSRDPNELPSPLRERMERIWRFEAQHERGAMGLSPLGHVYTPHGPGTPNEVLLELATSNLVGWMWGDTYSIVLFIDRKSLMQGDFSRIELEITN